MTTEKMPRYLRVSIKQGGYNGRRQVEVEVCVVARDTAEYDKNRCWRYGYTVGEYQDLKMRTVYSVYEYEGERRTDYFPLRIFYSEIYDLDLARAEVVTKTLGAIQRKMYKYDENDGPALSIGQTLARLVKVMGCAGVLLEDAAYQQATGYAYRELTNGAIVTTVDYRIENEKAWLLEV